MDLKIVFLFCTLPCLAIVFLTWILHFPWTWLFKTVITFEIMVAIIVFIIELDARRDFARAIDAGVLLFRTPKNMIASIDAFVSDVCDHLEGAQNHVVLNQSRVRARGEEEYDRTKNISRENFDIFDESAQGNKRDFWSEENSSHNSRQDSHSAVEQREMPQRSRRTERPKPIDVAYTSHLHNAFAGIKNKSGRR